MFDKATTEEPAFGCGTSADYVVQKANLVTAGCVFTVVTKTEHGDFAVTNIDESAVLTNG